MKITIKIHIKNNNNHPSHNTIIIEIISIKTIKKEEFFDYCAR